MPTTEQTLNEYLRFLHEHGTPIVLSQPEPTPPERYLTVEEAAALLHVSERTVYDALRSGRMEGKKVGRAWRVKRAWVEAFGRPNRRGRRS
jgi:excisionase family DNA binding protein